MGVFNSGVLVKGASAATYDYGRVPERIRRKVERIEAICDVYQVSLPAAAAQFSLAHPAVVSVVFGMSRPDNVRQTLGYLDEKIPDAFWQELVDDNILEAGVPLPQGARN